MKSPRLPYVKRCLTLASAIVCALLVLSLGTVVIGPHARVAGAVPERGMVRGPAADGFSEPPHTTWQVPTGAQHSWQPVAIDGNTVLMLHEQISGRPQNMHSTSFAIVLARLRIGSSHLQPIPASAYPHHVIAEEFVPFVFHLDGDWIVAATLNGAVNWTLWAGNWVTGQRYALDHGVMLASHGGPVRGFPSVAVDGARIVWTYTLSNGPNGSHFVRSHIEMVDLSTGRRQELAPQGESVWYDDPVLSGNSLAWVSTSRPGTVDQHTSVMLYNLHSHQLRNVSRPLHLARQYQPVLSISSRYLLFSSVFMSNWGRVVLVNLHTGAERVLDFGGNDGRLDDDLAVWDTGRNATSRLRILDLVHGRRWTLSTVPTVVAMQGPNLVLAVNAGPPVYDLWRLTRSSCTQPRCRAPCGSAPLRPRCCRFSRTWRTPVPPLHSFSHMGALIGRIGSF